MPGSRHVRAALGAPAPTIRSGPTCWRRSRRSTSAARPTSWPTWTTSGSRCGRTRRPTPGSCGTAGAGRLRVAKVKPGERETTGSASGAGCGRPTGARASAPAVRLGGARATEIAATLDAALPAKLEIDAADHQSTCRRADAGYEPVRTLPGARPPDHASPSPRSARRPRAGAVERRARRGGAPRPRGGLRRPLGERAAPPRSGRSGTRATELPPGPVAARGRSRQREVASSCSPPPTRRTGATVPVEAWINTVGTARAWRGKGVAPF